MAAERFAADNHLTSDEVIDIFAKYNVYEKMLSEHEYLHQVSIEEVFEYVSGLIHEESHEITLYHGSVYLFDDIDLSRSLNRRDFGMGFYTTVIEKQAFEWAEKLRSRKHTDKFYVYTYRFTFSDSLKIKRFDRIDPEWLELIKENRVKGGIQHNYDVVTGPVADDNTMETIQFYIAGIFTAKEAMDRLRYNNINNQVSFHTEKALKNLEFLRRTEYE
jgi:hypothetical protein